MKVLAFESSCDETSVAIVEDGRKVYSNIISSQIKTHKIFGGVVPEIASRAHVESINYVLDKALQEANLTYDDIDLVAATKGPGLVGALLVGLSAGKALALSLNKPFVGTNHIYGHICANYIEHKELKPPFVGLIVSGGHTYLLKVKDYIDFELMGQTMDDAAGEAFDKVARTMGIGYPGGPIIDKLAKIGTDNCSFPRVMINEDNYNFSFSGLKTAVINHLHNLSQKGESYNTEDIAASFQGAVVDVLVSKTIRLLKETGYDKIVLAGGVAANSGLREAFKSLEEVEGFKLYYPNNLLCTDNAAMIASAAYYTYLKGDYDKTPYANPNLGLK